MFCKRFIKTFTNSRAINLLKNDVINTTFGNYKNVVPLSTTSLALKDKKIKVQFRLYDGKVLEGEGKVGDSLLDVVVNNNLDLDGYGACEGTVTCSTCHVVLKKEDYDRIPEDVADEEKDMLDLAFGLTKTSRLGCQVILTKEMDGLEVIIPENVNDARS